MRLKGVKNENGNYNRNRGNLGDTGVFPYTVQ